VGNERARDETGAVVNERRRASVPGRECRRLVGDPEPTVGEGRAVGFTGKEAALGHSGLERLEPWDPGRTPVRVNERIVLHARRSARHAAAHARRREPTRKYMHAYEKNKDGDGPKDYNFSTEGEREKKEER